MKKASRALFLVAAALCAVVLGRIATKGLRSGLPEAYAGESRAPAVSAAREVSGVVTRVSDGDTIWVQDAKGLRHKIRMLDIDAPESTQTFGGESTARLKSLIGGKTVKVTYYETDKYGRLLGTVWLGGEDVNLKMVAEGMAWCYHYSRNERYAAAQSAARTRRAGLWADPNAQDPWAYRKGIKPQGEAQLKIPAGTANGKVFRLRGKGVPSLRGGSPGDLDVRIVVEVPARLDRKQRAALEEFQKLATPDVFPEAQRFASKAKVFFEHKRKLAK